MARQRRLIKLRRNSEYRNFSIEQTDPYPKKLLGVGPYQLVYKEKRIKLCPRHGDCRDSLEEIVRAHRELIQEMSKLRKDFCKKFNLPEFPERL
jgi:hypothetical protein